MRDVACVARALNCQARHKPRPWGRDKRERVDMSSNFLWDQEVPRFSRGSSVRYTLYLECLPPDCFSIIDDDPFSVNEFSLLSGLSCGLPLDAAVVFFYFPQTDGPAQNALTWIRPAYYNALKSRWGAERLRAPPDGRDNPLNLTWIMPAEGSVTISCRTLFRSILYRTLFWCGFLLS